MDISSYIDCNKNDYDGIQILLQQDDNELKDARRVASLQIGDRWGSWRDLTITFRDKSKEQYLLETKQSRAIAEDGSGTVEIVVQLHFSIEKRVDGLYGLWAYISADNFEKYN